MRTYSHGAGLDEFALQGVDIAAEYEKFRQINLLLLQFYSSLSMPSGDSVCLAWRGHAASFTLETNEGSGLPIPREN